MKLYKITLIISLIGILILIILSQSKPTQTATIESIKTSSNKIIIQIENSETELIIFDKPKLNLKKGNIIKFQGRADTYKNKSQIIIDKLKCSI
jgi:DNA/RNA endonuclease YhcR with UshA esterase domain